MPDHIFLDTETLGIDPFAPIWELAAVRRDQATGKEISLELFIRHDVGVWLDGFPEPFLSDYKTRFHADIAVTPYDAAHTIVDFCHSHPTLIGAVPSFDTERIARQWLEPLGLDRPWHYHLLDIENLVAGHLNARGVLSSPPWKSDKLSATLGINPDDYPRHTAMGDVRWAMAQWDRLFQNGRG
jgi:hypothetical protein